MKNIIRNQQCRSCKSSQMYLILDLGKTPLANSFLTHEQLHKKEIYYPLRLYFCPRCRLIQMRDIVSPRILFHNYVYVSSTSPVFIKHFEDFAKHVIKLYQLKQKSLVVDIGSNDGILLQPFKQQGYNVLGIEPAENVAQIAQDKGITTISEFFSIHLAKKIRQTSGIASLVTATNVFAHINDLDEVIKGVKILIEDKGVFIIEAPYLINFLEQNLFDTIYHEHLSYFAVYPLMVLFARLGMKVVRVERTDSHGGSIRVFVANQESTRMPDKTVAEFLKLEDTYKLNQKSTYKHFAKNIEKNKRELLILVNDLKTKGFRIAAYGAPAKGNTLLNYFGLDNKLIDYVVDDSKFKQGLYTPGTHIPVVDHKRIYSDIPDYLLILAWNFADSIMKLQHKYHDQGGKFIIPLPHPKII